MTSNVEVWIIPTPTLTQPQNFNKIEVGLNSPLQPPYKTLRSSQRGLFKPTSNLLRIWGWGGYVPDLNSWCHPYWGWIWGWGGCIYTSSYMVIQHWDVGLSLGLPYYERNTSWSLNSMLENSTTYNSSCILLCKELMWFFFIRVV